jgi:hypothetical protein
VLRGAVLGTGVYRARWNCKHKTARLRVKYEGRPRRFSYTRLFFAHRYLPEHCEHIAPTRRGCGYPTCSGAPLVREESAYSSGARMVHTPQDEACRMVQSIDCGVGDACYLGSCTTNFWSRSIHSKYHLISQCDSFLLLSRIE